MGRKIVLSQTAEKKLNKLFDYLLEEWSPKVKSDFVNKLDHKIKAIAEQPESFPESKKDKGLRKCVITKQTTLFYRFDDLKIVVVTVFDTRQDPNNLHGDL